MTPLLSAVVRVASIASALFLLCVKAAIAANGLDACVALAQYSAYNTSLNTGSSYSYGSFQSNFCSWYGSYRAQNSGATANVTIPVSDIPVGIGGSYTYGSADAVFSVLCTATSSLDTSTMELTRFRGHFRSYSEGVHHGKTSHLPSGVPA